MRENFTYGSVRGAAGDGSPYRDSTTRKLSCCKLLAAASSDRTGSDDAASCKAAVESSPSEFLANSRVPRAMIATAADTCCHHGRLTFHQTTNHGLPV